MVFIQPTYIIEVQIIVLEYEYQVPNIGQKYQCRKKTSKKKITWIPAQLSLIILLGKLFLECK